MAAGGACAAGPIQAIFPFAMPIALSGTSPKGRSSAMVATAALVRSRSSIARR
jgi:hypothetical protein